MSTGKYSLKLANVSKQFGSFEAVSDITLAIKPGEVVGFVGPNGAGKTTTISMIMGYINVTRGKVEVLGTRITTSTAHKVHHKVGYIAGDMSLPATLTGEQYLTFMATNNGRETKRFNQLVHQLAPVLDKPLKSLSRGNKQKIALIAALQHQPELLILDEPTSGLDPLMQDVFLDTICNESAGGTTVFMSSHILSEVSDVCNRIVFMKNGRFIVDKNIDYITEQLGKHVIIKSKNISSITAYAPEYAKVIDKSSEQLRLSVPKSELKPFMRWIVTKQFEDITVEDRELDDVFHELYMPIAKKGK
jgi:ABC-2 type transport system ATP-binding protein